MARPAAFPVCCGRYQECSRETGGEQEDAHDDGGSGKQLASVLNAALRHGSALIRIVAPYQGHDGNTSFEAAESEREAREYDCGCNEDTRPISSD